MRSFSAVLNILQKTSFEQNWDLKDELYIKKFSWILYTVTEQQWISSAIAQEVQWSSRSVKTLSHEIM